MHRKCAHKTGTKGKTVATKFNKLTTDGTKLNMILISTAFGKVQCFAAIRKPRYQEIVLTNKP